jgi:hypothetical protein
MTPNYASAIMLNNLVKSYNISISSTDYAQSTVEYCLAINNENSLKLNYGLSYLDPSKPEMMKNILVFGKGLSYNSDTRVELPNETDNQFGFSASDILSNLTEISNCYVLGAAWLTSNDQIEFSLCKSKLSLYENTCIYSKDISFEDIEDILKYNTDIVFPYPTNNSSSSVMLFKFILDVEKYVNEYKKDRVFIFVRDERKPRGYFGLPEEILYTKIAPRVIQANQDVINLESDLLLNIKTLVQKWIDLDGWSPDFQTYWETANPQLPKELRDFISNEIGINVVFQFQPSSVVSRQKLGTHSLVI